MTWTLIIAVACMVVAASLTHESFGERIASQLQPVARALHAKGFHEISPWWIATLTTWLTSGRRQLVLRVGRRGGKSSTLCALAVVVALYGNFKIPLGDVGVIAIVSVDRREAAGRLNTIEAMLRALGVPFTRSGDTIDLTGRPFRFQVFTATISGVSGFTTILAICDEVAKWRDRESGSNPATEVLASLRPTMATQPNALMVLSNSPLGSLDAHAKAFDTGDTKHQTVAHAATWIANPTISEERTHELEPDERVHAREYAALPQASVLQLLKPAWIGRAFEKRNDLRATKHAQRVLCIDASGGKRDTFAYAVVGWDHPAPVREQNRMVTHSYLRVEIVGGLEGRFYGSADGLGIVDQLATVTRKYGCRTVFGDQFESLMLHSAFRAKGLDFIELPWSAQSKPRAVALLRRWFCEGLIWLPDHRALKRELHAFEERITKSGHFTYESSGGHADYIAPVITAAIAEEREGLPQSLMKRSTGVGPLSGYL